MHGLYIGISLVLLMLLGACCVPLFLRVWKTPSRLRGAAINGVVLGCTLIGLCVALESWYYWIDVQSDGFEFTLSAKRWAERYGGPINSLGYRDAELPPPDAKQKLLLVVGDSFANGNGIKKCDDRFGNVLAAQLGSDWHVATVARGGWDTTDELRALRKFPRKPDAVVLQYYLNDIKHAALANHLQMAPPPPAPPGWAAPVINHSYAANALYWRIFRLVEYAQETLWDHITRYYGDEKLWREHLTAIDAFVTYTQSMQVPLYVVVFPNLSDVQDSAPLTAKVAEAFAARGAKVLDLAPAFANMRPQDLIVNPFDAHPNEFVHREAGQALHALIMQR